MRPVRMIRIVLALTVVTIAGVRRYQRSHEAGPHPQEVRIATDHVAR